MFTRITVLGLAFAAVALFTAPEVAADTGEPIESIDWTSIISALLEFFARVLEDAADVLRDGTEIIVDIFTED